MRRIELKSGELKFEDKDILGFIDKKVTPFGNSAKVDCPRKFVGKHAYLIISRK